MLSDISFKPTYEKVVDLPVLRAGLSPLNTSLVDIGLFNATATAEFWWYFPSLLTDSKSVKPVSPVNCSGEKCVSFFVPGTMRTIQLDPAISPISRNNYSDAVAYIQNDAPGYQVEFFPVQREESRKFVLEDCRVFGTEFNAVQICLRKTNSSFVAGNAFSSAFSYLRLECLSDACRSKSRLSQYN